MYRQAVFHADFDSLRDILGLPEEVRIISVDKMPHHVAGGVGLRVVMESPEFPETEKGETLPIVNLQYQSNGPSHRQFVGFQNVAVMAVEEINPDGS